MIAHTFESDLGPPCRHRRSSEACLPSTFGDARGVWTKDLAGADEGLAGQRNNAVSALDPGLAPSLLVSACVEIAPSGQLGTLGLGCGRRPDGIPSSRPDPVNCIEEDAGRSRPLLRKEVIRRAADRGRSGVLHVLRRPSEFASLRDAALHRPKVLWRWAVDRIGLRGDEPCSGLRRPFCRSCQPAWAVSDCSAWP